MIAAGADTLRRTLQEQLRTCVQCGLCLPTCATYLATGNEVQSPRGRLMLLGGLLLDEDPAQRPFALAALDQCIGCMACQSACPSGVPFALLDHGRSLAADQAQQWRPSRPSRALSRAWQRWLDRPAALRLARAAAACLRAPARALWGRRWRRVLAGGPAPVAALARLAGSLPRDPGSDRALLNLLRRAEVGRRLLHARTAPAPADSDPVREGAAVCGGDLGRGGGEPLDVVWMFPGCANTALLGHSARRLRDLLRRCGCEVRDVPGLDCCGALAAHAGRPRRAQDLAERNRRALAAACGQAQGGAVRAAVLVEAAGCGLHLKEQAGDLPAPVLDAAEILDGLTLPPLRPLPLVVAVHDPCHARHGQGVWEQARRLLGRIPRLTIVEPDEAEVCCGSGGPWSLSHPELAGDLGRRKAAILAATGADLIVTGNPGCLGQIQDGLLSQDLQVPILPLSDLLWYASLPGTGDIINK